MRVQIRANLMRKFMIIFIRQFKNMFNMFRLPVKKNRLIEAIILCTHNICFVGKEKNMYDCLEACYFIVQ